MTTVGEILCRALKWKVRSLHLPWKGSGNSEGNRIESEHNQRELESKILAAVILPKDIVKKVKELK